MLQDHVLSCPVKDNAACGKLKQQKTAPELLRLPKYLPLDETAR
jgi:hypothetical protein